MINLDKTYMTRSGKEVKLLRINSCGEYICCPVVGYIEDVNRIVYNYWFIDGIHIFDR